MRFQVQGRTWAPSGRDRAGPVSVRRGQSVTREVYVFTPVRTRRAFEGAVEQITDVIRAGDLLVGDRLPSERALAAQMAISRPTLREAVKLLSDCGVLTVRPGPAGGMFVRSEVVPGQLLEETSRLRLSDVSEVLEARRLFEPRVALLAALHGTEEDFDAMRRTIDRQRECPDDRDRVLQLDLQFHLRLARATRNSTIVSLMRSLFRQLELARGMTLRGTHEPAWVVSIHERTLQAVMQGDPDAVDAVMDEHMRFLEKLWEAETGRPRLRRTPDFLLPLAEHSIPPAEGAELGSSPRIADTRAAIG